ncbi:MAG: CopG family transcriptional regulator [Patescibacteria group bacterium]
MATITIPDELKSKLDKVAADSDEFSSTDDYVTYVLKQVADKVSNKEEEKKQNEVYSKEDEDKIKQRLQNLGYLD